MSVRSATLALLCLAGCSGADERNDSAAAERPQATARASSGPRAPAGADRAGTWQAAGSYRVRSLVSGVFIQPADDLAVVAYQGDQDSFCGTSYATPTTPEGKWARARGWRVGAEASLGPLTLVNVMRRYHYEAQACGQIEGKIILFRSGRPMAAIRVAMPAMSDTLAIEALNAQESGAVRLQNQWIVPFGDLVMAGRNVEIRALPAADPVCRGKQAVPNMFGQPIHKARVTLRAAGWMPARAATPVYGRNSDGSLDIENLTQFELYKQGITEVSGCAPTGFCAFDYRSARAKLTVSTMGEEAVSYSVDCG